MDHMYNYINVTKIEDLYKKTIPFRKDRQLIIVPTTCGTGSEMTNLSVINMTNIETKIGLVSDDLHEDYAILIPELLKGLPFEFFLFSSIDAFIHEAGLYVSPGSNKYTELFSIKAIELILDGYQKLIVNGKDYRHIIIHNFLVASNFAGIAFGNTGVGAVHALSYTSGSKYNVLHGESTISFLLRFSELIQEKN